MAPRESENKFYAKCLGDKQEHYGALWYFLEWSIVHGSSEFNSSGVTLQL